MELSGNAKRAMEQVERNLSVLYGADYFTEEEWVKLDALLHKGRYVLSDGPPVESEADEEPLMTFDESRAGTAQDVHDSVQEAKSQVEEAVIEVENEVEEAVAVVPDDQSFCQTRSDPLMDSDDESVSSPASQHDTSPGEAANETPAETSDDGGSFPQPESAELPVEPQIAGEAEAATAWTPEEQPQAEAEAPQPETQVPQGPRYTQAQIDEVRAFNAGLTKAGHKGRPKYNKAEEEEENSEWNQGYDDEPLMDEQAYPSPPQTEREARIDSWAEGVVKLPPSDPSAHIVSPVPGRAGKIPPAVEQLAERFVKAHGRMPRSLNDFYQPNNPQHHPRRPDSQASSKTSKTATTVKSAAVQLPANGIVLGKVYVAQSAASARGIRIDVRRGDPIKVTKYVSGVMYIGENLRSHETGQFPETIFQRSAAPSHPAAKGRRGLDQVENSNAAEWDDLSSVSRSSIASPTAPASHLGGGLAASRYSSVPERPPARRSAQAQPGDIAADMAGQIGKIINEKFEEMLKTRMGPQTPQPSQSPYKPAIQPPSRPAAHRSSPPAASKPGQKMPFYVEPKTETCWFWSVKNDCRFTAEQCRDLHAFIPNRTGTPKNLHNGKPTWGALADYPDYVPPSVSDEALAAILGNAAAAVDEQKSKGKACYYWAVLGSCENTAESCRYLHEHTPNGIAAKPGRGKTSSWKRDWRAAAADYNTESPSNENEFVLQEVEDVGEEHAEDDEVRLDGWGYPIKLSGGSGGTYQPSGGYGSAGTYKPPHVRLEESAASTW